LTVKFFDSEAAFLTDIPDSTAFLKADNRTAFSTAALTSLIKFPSSNIPLLADATLPFFVFAIIASMVFTLSPIPFNPKKPIEPPDALYCLNHLSHAVSLAVPRYPRYACLRAVGTSFSTSLVILVDCSDVILIPAVCKSLAKFESTNSGLSDVFTAARYLLILDNPLVTTFELSAPKFNNDFARSLSLILILYRFPSSKTCTISSEGCAHAGTFTSSTSSVTGFHFCLRVVSSIVHKFLSGNSLTKLSSVLPISFF